MASEIDWNDQRNKIAGGVLIAGFALLILSAFNPVKEWLTGTPLWIFRTLCIAGIAYCVNVLFTRSAIVMLFLGFSAGIPILLIFSSLSLWLGEAGMKKSMVTFFSWAALGYSFKFVWAPLIDKLPVPFLTRSLGRRRAWMLVSQFAVIGSILLMAFTDPASGGSSLTVMALGAVALGFSSATQDIVIDAYRIECAPADEQAMISSTYIAGYRIGMIVAGAGALYLASYFGTTKEEYSYDAWMMTYAVMAGVMLIGVATTFIIREPATHRPDEHRYGTSDYLRFLAVFVLAVLAFIIFYYLSSSDFAARASIENYVSKAKESLNESLNNGALAGFIVNTVRLFVAVLIAFGVAVLLILLNVADRKMISEAYAEPVRDFFRRYGLGLATLFLLLIGLYRVSDIVMGAIANVFYQELGYSKDQIASVSKFFGLIMTIAGGLLGGFLSVRYGVMRILFLGAVLSAITNLLFIALAQSSVNIPMLAMVIGADNLSAGLASAAFIAFLSSLTNVSFTAMQYAIFSSLMTLFPKILGGYSGSMAESMGYTGFFTMTALLTLPVLVIIFILRNHVNDKVEFAKP